MGGRHILRNFILAILGPGSAHLYAGRLRRGLGWAIAVALAWPTLRWMPWIVLALLLAQIVDGTFLEDGDPPEPMARALYVLACLLLFFGGRALVRKYVEPLRITAGSMIPTASPWTMP